MKGTVVRGQSSGLQEALKSCQMWSRQKERRLLSLEERPRVHVYLGWWVVRNREDSNPALRMLKG